MHENRATKRIFRPKRDKATAWWGKITRPNALLCRGPCVLRVGSIIVVGRKAVEWQTNI
jgi:hypothetical protein